MMSNVTQSASNDPSCWSSGFTFEFCCIPWNVAWVGVGNDECWIEGYTYERCCLPTAAPRRSFACKDRGIMWQRFRRDLMLGTRFADSEIREVNTRDPNECILGSLLAALSTLVLLSQSVVKPDESNANSDRLLELGFWRAVCGSPFTTSWLWLLI